MATVTGLTKERMLEIEANSVVDGEVVGDDLILTKHNGTTINAGHVRGDPGPVDLEEWLDYADPPGTPKAYEGAALPARHGWCDAAVEFDGALYPKLAALFLTGTNCVNGACAAGFFRLPNHKGRFMVARDATIGAFDTLRETGGNKDAVVVLHDHTASSTSDQPAHSHTADQAAHDHGGATVGATGAHFHTGSIANVLSSADNDHEHTSNTGYVSEGQVGGAVAGEVPVNVDTDGAHQHNIPGSDPAISVSSEDPGITTTTTVNNQGVSGTDKNLPPYRVVNVIMRLT